MRNQGDSRIEERLIGDALTEHMDRVDLTQDLWPGIRDRLSQRRQARFPVFVRVAAVTTVVALLAFVAIVRPWSLFDDPLTPFAAVAHAYEGLLELETVRYRVDGSGSIADHYSTLHQVDLVNNIDYSVMSLAPDSDGNSPLPGPASISDFSRFESILINGKSYTKFTTSAWEQQRGIYHSGYRMSRDGDEVIRVEDGEWTLDAEVTGWEPFGELGGLPWSLEVAEDRFDQVELVGVSEIEGQPAVHYRASRRSTWRGKLSLAVPVRDRESGEFKPAKAVYGGTEDYSVFVNTVDLWVTANEGRLLKIDWTQVEQAPPIPSDFEARDWCQGLGEFAIAEYAYRGASDPVPGFQILYFDTPQDSGWYKLLTITCWNKDRSEARIVWGRSLAEKFGVEFWMRWIYTFIAFNEPLDLPEDLPE